MEIANKNDYPEEFLRGVPNDSEQCITPEGYPMQGVFKFDDYDSERKDGFQELSINWLDDENAVTVLLNQINTRKNVPQFQGGYCRLERAKIASLQAYLDGFLFYERRPIKADEKIGISENPYHGNILMKQNISKHLKNNIQATLALLAGAVIRRK